MAQFRLKLAIRLVIYLAAFAVAYLLAIAVRAVFLEEVSSWEPSLIWRYCGQALLLTLLVTLAFEPLVRRTGGYASLIVLVALAATMISAMVTYVGWWILTQVAHARPILLSRPFIVTSSVSMWLMLSVTWVATLRQPADH